MGAPETTKGWRRRRRQVLLTLAACPPEAGRKLHLPRLYTEEATEQRKATSCGGRGGKGLTQGKQPTDGRGSDTKPKLPRRSECWTDAIRSERLTGPPLADLIRDPKVSDGPSPGGGRHHFLMQYPSSSHCRAFRRGASSAWRSPLPTRSHIGVKTHVGLRRPGTISTPDLAAYPRAETAHCAFLACESADAIRRERLTNAIRRAGPGELDRPARIAVPSGAARRACPSNPSGGAGILPTLVEEMEPSRAKTARRRRSIWRFRCSAIMRPPLIAFFSSSLLCWRGAAIRLASMICPDMAI